jgi:replication factor A2
VVIKQILDAEEGVKLFDLNYSMLVFVAIVRRIDHSSTKVTYLLEDHTGQIEGHYWLENDGDSQQVPQVMLDSYAKIVGSARNTGGIKTLMIYKMIPVKQANQVNTHLLEVLNARYKAEAYSKVVLCSVVCCNLLMLLLLKTFRKLMRKATTLWKVFQRPRLHHLTAMV